MTEKRIYRVLAVKIICSFKSLANTRLSHARWFSEELILLAVKDTNLLLINRDLKYCFIEFTTMI